MHEQSIKDFLSEGMIDYTLYVCTQRAIPDIRDGLKTSQRIMLWTHYKHCNGKVKTAALSGLAAANGYYVHGEASAHETTKMLAGHYVNNIPLFKGYGAFGTLAFPKEMGAPRYTSVDVSAFAKSVLFSDIDIVDKTPTVDGDSEICETFYPSIPLVLLNGSNGIAVGYKTNILPHKLEDIKNFVIDVMDGRSKDNILPHYSNYDVDVGEIDNLKYSIQGRITVDNTTTVRITAIPPSITLEKLQEKLDSLLDDKKIVSYQNNVTDTFEIVVKFRRSDLNNFEYDDLIDLFGLKTKVTEKLVVVGFDGRSIVEYDNHYQLVKDWIDWRRSILSKRFVYLEDQAKAKREFLTDFKILYDAGFHERLHEFRSRRTILDYIDLNCYSNDRLKIAEYPIYRWTQEHYDKVVSEIDALNKEIDQHQKSQNQIDQHLREEVSNL